MLEDLRLLTNYEMDAAPRLCLLLPRISNQAAVQPLDILEQLLECVRHHYAAQIERWQRRQRHSNLPFDPTPPPDDGLPF